MKMICYEWFVNVIQFQKETAQAMERYMYSNLRQVKFQELLTMSDVNIAHRFHAGVFEKLFSTDDVRQLIEMLDVVYKNGSETGLFWAMYDFLTKSLKLQKDLAHCMAFGLEDSPTRLLQLTNDEISHRLMPVFLEDWLSSSDVTLLLRRLDIYYPNRQQRSQASTTDTINAHVRQLFVEQKKSFAIEHFTIRPFDTKYDV